MQDFDYDLLRSWQEKTIEETIKKNEFHSFHVIKGNTSLVGLPQPNVLWLLVDEVLVSNDQRFFGGKCSKDILNEIQSCRYRYFFFLG